MTKEEIHNICSKYNIKNYTINDDLSIDVDADVYLSRNNLFELSLKFNKVSGIFDCSDNKLTSLEGAPSSVGGYFDCSNNDLTSLECAPSSVEGGFYCYSNSLESLKGIPLNLSDDKLVLPKHFTYNDYIAYFRNLKFKKLLK